MEPVKPTRPYAAYPSGTAMYRQGEAVWKTEFGNV